MAAFSRKFKVEIHSGDTVRTVYAQPAGPSGSAGRRKQALGPLEALGLEKANYAEFLVTREAAPGEVCTICSQELESPAASLACGHSFHRRCILTWTWDNVTCPNCRQDIGATRDRDQDAPRSPA